MLSRSTESPKCPRTDEHAFFPQVHLQLVNGFRLIHNRTDDVQLTPVGERLLTFLALRGPSSRQHLAFRLWPDRDEEQALGCLRTTLWRLPRLEGDPLVHADATTTRLAGHVEADVHRRYSEAAAWANGAVPPPGLEIDGFTGDILDGWEDDWAIIERERFRQMRLHVLERLSLSATRSGRFSDAVAAGQWAVEGAPLRESAHRCLVHALLAKGDPSGAVRQVRAYLADLDHAGLPLRLSPALTELLPAHALALLVRPHR